MADQQIERLAVRCRELRKRITKHAGANLTVDGPLIDEIEQLSGACGFPKAPITRRKIWSLHSAPITWIDHCGFDTRAESPEQAEQFPLGKFPFDAASPDQWEGVAATLSEWGRGLNRLNDDAGQLTEEQAAIIRVVRTVDPERLTTPRVLAALEAETGDKPSAFAAKRNLHTLVRRGILVNERDGRGYGLGPDST